MISEKAEGLIDDFEESCDEYDVHKRNIPKMNLKNYIEQLEEENNEMFETILLGSRLDSDDWSMSLLTMTRMSNIYDEKRIKILENKLKKSFREILTGETLWDSAWDNDN